MLLLVAAVTMRVDLGSFRHKASRNVCRPAADPFLGDPPETGAQAVVRLKEALEDLKAFYSEAAAAKPGASSADMSDWLWQETALGRLMFTLSETLAATGDEALTYMAKGSMVPRAQREKARAAAS